MSPQQYFDSCSRALLGSSDIPATTHNGMTHSYIQDEVTAIRETMDPRAWKSEIHLLAADLSLTTDAFDVLWEGTERRKDRQ